MGMTITEKTLAKGCGKSVVSPGENVWVNVDVLMTHDICGPGAINVFHREFGKEAKVWDKDKIVIIPDHFIFTKDERAQKSIQEVRNFVKEQNLKYFYDTGSNFKGTLETIAETYKGVCHVALAQEGHNRPGEILFGTDSHTCTSGAFGTFATGIGDADAGLIMGIGQLWLKVPETMKFVFNGIKPEYIMAKDMILQVIGDIGFGGATYKAMEFDGEGVQNLSVEEKMTLCNMAIEAGGKNGIIPASKNILDYVNARTKITYEVFQSDSDAKYHTLMNYDIDKMEPVVAKPHSPDNKELARNLSDVKLDRSYIGSCTGGKIDDFKAAARILKGNRVKIDTFIVPATQEVYRDLQTTHYEGEPLIDIFKKSGAIGPLAPGCQACLGGPQDTVARANKEEVVISTTNRNFIGRMGSKKASIYLASPMTAAASAINGFITDPREYLV